MTTLKQQNGGPLRSIGSLSLVRSTFKAGLVDPLRLMFFPVILGNRGREPIYTDFPQAALELIRTRILDSAVIDPSMHYESRVIASTALSGNPLTHSRLCLRN
jgi:dihydrofolate reductase